MDNKISWLLILIFGSLHRVFYTPLLHSLLYYFDFENSTSFFALNTDFFATSINSFAKSTESFANGDFYYIKAHPELIIIPP